MGLTVNTARRLICCVAWASIGLIGTADCYAAVAAPMAPESSSAAAEPQSAQENPPSDSPTRPTREERRELKRIKAEQEALAKAAAKQAREFEKQQERDERARRKAEKQSQREAKKAISTIKSLEIEERDGEALLTIETTKKNKWLAKERPGGGLILQLTASEMGRSVTALSQQEGIVAAVTPRRSQVDPGATEIEIVTRARASSSIQEVPSGLLVRLQPATDTSSTADRETERASANRGLASPSEFDATLDNSEYKVGAGDLLAIEIFGLPELSREIRVEGNGSVNFPVLGGVEIAGLSVRNAEVKLESLLAERGLVNNPVVSIVVKEYLSRGVSVQGEVNRPGVYQLLGPKRLLELLVEAGGLSGGDSAGRTIYVLRNVPGRGQLRTEIDAERLMELGDLSLNVALQPGDIIQIPRSERARVYVSGAVRTPGPVDYHSSEELTVLQVVSAAGGPTERARVGAVQIIRRHEDGTEERFEVDLKKIRNGKAPDFVLQPGDTVVLKEWFF